MDIYRHGIRPLLFSGLNVDPEWAHNNALQLLSYLSASKSTLWGQYILKILAQSFGFSDPRLQQTYWGVPFPNPIGLAAGFDKDGVAAPLWGNFGFGFAELGTVTLHAQPGNPQPRLFRLPADRAVLNRMGFNNQGAITLAKRLQQDFRLAEGLAQALEGEQSNRSYSARAATKSPNYPQITSANFSKIHLSPSHNMQPIPIGINLGKSKMTPLEDAVEEYCESFEILKPWGDYFVINVSSPNTPGLRSLQNPELLGPLFESLQSHNQPYSPLLVKVAPDLDWTSLERILELVQHYQLDGIIATNTTIERTGLKTQHLKSTGNLVSQESGGLSGRPLRDRSTEIIRFLWQQSDGQIPIIGVGGIFTAEDAWAKLTAGACLLQVYTGWIYEGPAMVRRILTGLIDKLDQAQLPNLASAIGINTQ